MDLITIFRFILGEDDLTSEGDGVGNAGARLACGIIMDTEPGTVSKTIMCII